MLTGINFELAYSPDGELKISAAAKRHVHCQTGDGPARGVDLDLIHSSVGSEGEYGNSFTRCLLTCVPSC